MFAVWIRIDDRMPWIELKGSYQTRSEAKKAAENFRNRVKMKIVNMPENVETMKAMAAIKTRR